MESFHVHDNQNQMENMHIFVKSHKKLHKIYKTEALQQQSKIHMQKDVWF